MVIQYTKNNEIRGISIAYNEQERDHIMELKKFFDFHLHQIKVRTTDGKYAFLSLLNIYYFEVVDGRCYIYDASKIYIALDTFQNLKGKLVEYGFVQCNKTQVINSYHLHSIEIYKDCQRIATLDNDEIIQVSRKYKQNIDLYRDVVRF